MHELDEEADEACVWGARRGGGVGVCCVMCLSVARRGGNVFWEWCLSAARCAATACRATTGVGPSAAARTHDPGARSPRLRAGGRGGSARASQKRSFLTQRDAPMIRKPIIVADAIRANSFLSGLVHFFTKCMLSFTNCLKGWTMTALTSDIVAVAECKNAAARHCEQS